MDSGSGSHAADLGQPNSNGAAAGRGTDSDSDGLRTCWRLFASLAPRFLREGYHPENAQAVYSVAMSLEEKAGLLADARLQERYVMAALRHLLGSTGGDGTDGAEGPAALAGPQLLPPPPPNLAAAAAAVGSLSYDWPSFEVTVEELADDEILAEVAGAQWGVRQRVAGGGTARHADGDVRSASSLASGGGGDDGLGGGGTLVMTLDVCGGLLQRHPDPTLRQQVYEEGLVPLASHALGLLQRLRDLRAQQAALYGMYDTAGVAASAPTARRGRQHPEWRLAALPCAGTGYGGLSHLDTLARDGRAAAGFLTSLAEELEPLAAKQLQQLAHAASPEVPSLDASSFEYLLRAQTWDGASAEGSVARSAVLPAAAFTANAAIRHAACSAGDDAGDAGGGRGCSPDEIEADASAVATTHTGVARTPDPAAPYLTDAGALLAGISDWLSAFMGVQLRRPGGGPGGGVVEPQPSADGGRGVGQAHGVDGRPVPYDVDAMLGELRAYYGAWRVDAFGDGDGSSGGSGGSGPDSASRAEHWSLALAAVAEASAREPRRFLAYRLVVEGEEEAVGSASAGAAAAQDRGAVESAPVRWLLLDLQGGFGTRYLLPPLVAGVAVATSSGADAGSASSSGSVSGFGAEGRDSRAQYAQAGAGTVAAGPEAGKPGLGLGMVAAVVVGLQSGGGSGGGGVPPLPSAPLLTRGSEFFVWELLHELGHALHFLLAAAAPPPEDRVQSAANAAAADAAARAPTTTASRHHCAATATPQLTLRPSSHALLPYQLPLELVELPSSFLERAAAEAEVLEVMMAHCRHFSTRQPTPRAVCHALARAVHFSYYSPVSVLLQVLSSLLDQLLLQSPRKAPGMAADLWSQLLATFAPSLPVTCSVQQLHSLARIASASGQGYAYVTAGYLADELWSARGFGADADEDSGVGGRHAGICDQEKPEDGLRRQRRRRRIGRLVRRLLFESDAGDQPQELLARLLGELHVAAATIEAGDEGGASPGAPPRPGSVTRVTAKGSIAAGSSGVGPEGDVVRPEGDVVRPPGRLKLLPVAGDCGCVPRVCADRVRRWIHGSEGS